MNNKFIGNSGEDLAANYLKQNGYLIIKRNVKLSYFEIDIIAEKNNKVSFVEVKTKRSLDQNWSPEDLIGRKKYKSFKRGVQIYCAKNKISLFKISLDLIAITIDSNKMANIKHYIDII